MKLFQLRHFNPRSREGSDCPRRPAPPHGFSISIHAPEKGATPTLCRFYPQCHISIHAPEKGATSCTDQPDFLTVISIHAPEKGATLIPLLMIDPMPFQSTLPRRERPAVLDQLGGDRHFNPRSREGSDRHTRISELHFLRFQSTLPRRERPCKIRCSRVFAGISIHAPEKGATA